MARHVLSLTGWIVTVCPDSVLFEHRGISSKSHSRHSRTHLSTDQFNLQGFGGFDDAGGPFVVAWGSCRADSSVKVTFTQKSDGFSLVAEPVLDDGVWIADMDREVSELTLNIDDAEKTQRLTRLFRDEGAPGLSYGGWEYPPLRVGPVRESSGADSGEVEPR